MRQKYGVLHLGGEGGVFVLAQKPGPLGGGGHKQGHLQPLQSPQGAQPEMRLLWFGLSLQAQVGSFFYSLYNINRISMYTWAPSRGRVPKSPVHMGRAAIGHSAEAQSLSPQQVRRARSLCPVLCHLRSAVSPGA